MATSDRQSGRPLLWIRGDTECGTPPRVRVHGGEEEEVGGHLDGPNFLRGGGEFLRVRRWGGRECLREGERGEERREGLGGEAEMAGGVFSYF